MDGLPDELLISIVSRLSVNEAARTSVLARRWRHFWIYNRILNFDDGSEMVRERKRFEEWVNRVVSLHSGETIDESRVCLCLDNNINGSDIDRWIEFALRKRVQKLELNFQSMTRDDTLVYRFPNLRNLGVGVSHSLVSLSLTRVYIRDEIMESFMSNCPTLEELHLKNAFGLKIFRPSFRATRLLRRLALMDCKDLKIIEIFSPNLVSFALSTSMTQTHTVLNGVSSLIHLSLRAFVLFELLAHLDLLSHYLSRLETLELHTISISTLITVGWWRYYCPRWRYYCPRLPRLKKIVLEFDVNENAKTLRLCHVMINAAPLLREIVLMLKGVPRPPRPPPKRQHEGLQKHECLKVLEIVGYAGIALDLEMALYALDYAVSLEKVVIDGVATTGGEDLYLLKRNLLAIVAAQNSSYYTSITSY